MNLVKCNIDSIQSAKTLLEEKNRVIIDDIQIIYNELNDISSILNTPKSSLVVPMCMEKIENISDYLMREKDFFINTFNIVEKSYTQFSNDISEKVGMEK